MAAAVVHFEVDFFLREKAFCRLTGVNFHFIITPGVIGVKFYSMQMDTLIRLVKVRLGLNKLGYVKLG